MTTPDEARRLARGLDGFYSDEGDALRSLADQLDAATKWRPIETAPRDGARVLGLWISAPGGRNRCEVTAYIDVLGWTSDDGDCEWESPTHWLPLPPPPEPAS